jgi:hypothetical protein
MSDQIPNESNVRDEEPELADEALEQVAGGCHQGESLDLLTIVPTLPTYPILDSVGL